MSVKIIFNFKENKEATMEAPLLNGEDLYLKGSNGCCAILVHGLTGSPHEMRFLAHSLNEKGYSVILPRLANHGRPIEILRNSKWQDFYNSVRDAFMQVKQNNEMIFAAGLSMGALLVLLLADEFEDKITAVSCLSPTLFYDGWNVPWYSCFLPALYATPLKRFFYFKEDPPYGIKDEKIRNSVHKYYSRADINDISQIARHGYPFFPVTLLYQLHLLVNYLTVRLPRINVPLQLIQARNDDVTSMKNSEFIYNRVKSKKKELLILENSYHVVTADQEKEKVSAKVEEFFGKIARTGNKYNDPFEKKA